MSPQHQEGLAHLLYGINQGSCFVALTGEVGTGKTTLCNCLLGQLDSDVDIALILNPKLDANELLASICDELGISYDKARPTLKNLTDTLNTYLLSAHALSRKTIVLIDEAQNLSLDVLEQIRLLTNLETSKNKLLQIILVAQTELKELLENPALRQLNQRITARYHLSPLSYAETKEYIQHRLHVSGGYTDIFTPAAIKKIYSLSKGIPRLINILCDRSLLGAYVKNSHTVTPKIVNQSAKEVLSTSPISDFNKIHLGWGFACVLALLLFSIFYVGSDHKVESSPQQSLADLKSKTTQPVRSDFYFYINQQETQSLNSAISQLTQIWGHYPDKEYDCTTLETVDIECSLGQSNWEDLVSLNRPAILEFNLPNGRKNYIVFIGFKNGNPIFKFNSERSFPLDQVLKFWQGYYIVLWQPPIYNHSTVFPGQSSEAVLWIKKKIISNPNYSLSKPNHDFFDHELTDAIVKFQKYHHLTPDGIVGAKTFIHLQNNDPNNNSPKLK
jgi:general secretion pathway protein A